MDTSELFILELRPQDLIHHDFGIHRLPDDEGIRENS